MPDRPSYLGPNAYQPTWTRAAATVIAPKIKSGSFKGNIVWKVELGYSSFADDRSVKKIIWVYTIAYGDNDNMVIYEDRCLRLPWVPHIVDVHPFWSSLTAETYGIEVEKYLRSCGKPARPLIDLDSQSRGSWDEANNVILDTESLVDLTLSPAAEGGAESPETKSMTTAYWIGGQCLANIQLRGQGKQREGAIRKAVNFLEDKSVDQGLKIYSSFNSLTVSTALMMEIIRRFFQMHDRASLKNPPLELLAKAKPSLESLQRTRPFADIRETSEWEAWMSSENVSGPVASNEPGSDGWAGPLLYEFLAAMNR